LTATLSWTGGWDQGDVDAETFDVPDGHTTDNKIHRSEGLSDLDINSQGTYSEVDVNDTACHQGNSSGWSCGVVESVTDPDWDYKTNAPGIGTRVIRVGGVDTNFGDSGGPWVTGNRAWGLHESGQGGTNIDGWFTSVQFDSETLLFVVKTK